MINRILTLGMGEGFISDYQLTEPFADFILYSAATCFAIAVIEGLLYIFLLKEPTKET